MHPVLQTKELLLEIVEYLEYNPRSLISLATTCQDFSAPACSVIWRNCDWFGPFVKLLPQSKYVLEDSDKISPPILISDLTHEDVARIRYYAPFVKRLSPKRYYPGINELVLGAILSALHAQHFFPQPPDPALRRTDGICAPSRISHWTSNTIRCLTIHTNEPQPDRTHELLAGWDTLEDLAVNADIRFPTAEAIAALPRLGKLRIFLRGKLDIPSHRAFPANVSLQHLELMGEPPSRAFEDYLAILRPTSLTYLIIVIFGGIQGADLCHLCESVRVNCSTDSLDRLELSLPSTQDEPMAFHDIQSLLSFTNLVYVGLFYASYGLKDDDIAHLAQSWPRLRQLTLRHASCSSTEIPTCTLNSILAFAQHCPDLETLVMAVDATAVIMPNRADIAFRRAHTCLRTFEVLHSPIVAPVEVASFLTRFFPSLNPEGLVTPELVQDERREQLWEWTRCVIPIMLDARRTGIHGDHKGDVQAMASHKTSIYARQLTCV
ncbi:hypothetical protein K525DRAFT_270165 [Schizophyllum commune Loenen D]|nr:hypothetical protein K525DRAFT_270165 [Schizophyllum commune Loenen D]